MTPALIQTGRGIWFTADHAYRVGLLTPTDRARLGRVYAIREARHGTSAFVYVMSLDQVPEAIEEYKNRKAISVLTGKPIKPMFRWAPRTPRRKCAHTGELRRMIPKVKP